MRRNMPPTDRAKQFMPFAALSGYTEALRQKEFCPQPRKELGEDRIEELNRVLTQLSPGDQVRLTYYSGGAYRARCGTVTKISPETGILRIDEDRIPFADLAELELIGNEESLPV